jgi:hypothetical protein
MALDEGIQGIDDQELGERTEAARRYGEEDPDIYVDFCHSCIKESEDANLEIRYLWDQCYRAYRAQIDYSEKEDWQAKMVTGDMTATVKQGVAVIRKALRQPDWYSIEGVGDEDKQIADFFREALRLWLNPQHARLDTAFCDGSELGFAIGQSHEMIPRWVPGKGLVFSLVPPWQIYRDPDATPREPWSGDYWDHVEWLDLWKVKNLGGRYVRLDEITANESAWGKETAEKRARRKGQYYQRTTFRHAVRLVEHWGVILDKQGELLLDNARFTVAGDVLIRNPEPNPFVTMRWPGVSFSPLPDLFAFEGHGVIETSLLLWLNTCNLMSLHIDDLSWRVNKLRELNRMDLEDPTDVAMFPGKTVLKSPNVPAGQQVVKEVYTSPSTNETLATLQHWDQRRENSSFVNQFVAGQRGTRTQITKGEVELKTSQSMTIFDSIGEDIEEGAINVIRAALEVLILNWSEYSNPTISRVMSNNPAAAKFAAMPIEAKKEMLRANCDIKISGISAQIKNSELVPRYQELMKDAVSSEFGKYFKPYRLLKRKVNSFGFYEADFIVTDDQAEAIDLVEETLKKVEEMAAQQAGGAIDGGNGGAGAGVVATPEAVPPGNEPMIEGGVT